MKGEQIALALPLQISSGRGNTPDCHNDHPLIPCPTVSGGLHASDQEQSWPEAMCWIDGPSPDTGLSSIGKIS